MAATQVKNAGKTPTKKPVATKKTAGKAKPQNAKNTGASKGSVYTKPEARERIKKQVTAGSDGGAPGQWSARKANLVTEKYKKAGGGFKEELRGKGSKKQAEIKDKAAAKVKTPAPKGKASAVEKPKKASTKAQPKTKAENKPAKAKPVAAAKAKPAAKSQAAAKPAAKTAAKPKAKAAAKSATKKAVKAK